MRSTFAGSGICHREREGEREREREREREGGRGRERGSVNRGGEEGAQNNDVIEQYYYSIQKMGG